MAELPISVCRVNTPAGVKDYVTCVPHEQAFARGLSVREKMAAEEGGSMSADETARYLGITKQSVLNLYHSGKLLGWRTEKQGAVRFPVWQFSEGRRLPGLEKVLAARL